MDTYFDIQDHVIVTNPTTEPFGWRVGGERDYTIEPGQVKRLHGSAAFLYVKKMTDLLLIQENRVTELHSEEARKEIADNLIIKIIQDNEDVEAEEVNLEEVAQKNDKAPVVTEPEFPTIKKPEPKPEVKETKPEKVADSDKSTKTTSDKPKVKAK